MNKKLFTVIIFSILTLFLKVNIAAQKASDVLPCDQYDTSVFDACGDVNSQVTNLIKVILALVFAGIILYGIFLIIKAAITIIRSNGDPSQIESGVKMMRGVYIGIGIIFVGLIGLIIVIAFFGAGGILNVPINAPENTQIPLITS